MSVIEVRERLREAIRPMRTDLDQALTALGVDCYAYYAGRDPFVPTCLRCLAVKAAFPETTSHFRQKPIPTAAPFLYCQDARTDPLRDGNSPLANALLTKDPQRNLVFGDFVTREKIASRAWFLHRDPLTQQPAALLTINYRKERPEAEWLAKDREPLEKVFTSLVRQLGRVSAEFQEADNYLGRFLIGILDLVLPVHLRSQRSPPGSLQELLSRILQAAIALFDLPPRDWCGTIHLLDPTRRRLQLAVGAGGFSCSESPEYDLEAGDGILSWVAVRQQGIRIPDFDQAPAFKALKRRDQTCVKSQLAVPLMGDGETVGVLSLESPASHVFGHTSVGFLTRVASFAALVIQQDLYRKSLYALTEGSAGNEALPRTEEDVLRLGQAGASLREFIEGLTAL